MMAFSGSNVLLYAKDGGSYIEVGYQTGLSAEESTNLIEVSYKNKTHTHFIPGKDDGKLTLEALHVVSDQGLQALKNAHRNQQPIYIQRQENGGKTQYNQALIESYKVENPDEDVATISVELQLTQDWSDTAL